MKPIKIGFDISQTGTEKAGCGYFANSLISALAELDKNNNYLLYSNFGDFYWNRNCHDVCNIYHANFKYLNTHNSQDSAKIFWRDAPPDLEKKLGAPDIIHVNNFFCFATKLPNTKLIYTLYDLSFIEHPDWTTEENRLGCFSGVFNASLNADFIIAISEYSRQNFLKIFPHYPSQKIQVIYPASRFSENSQKAIKSKRLSFLEKDKFWLTVGTIEPRKNHKRLLEAYAKLRGEKTINHMPLVFAGGDGWKMDDFKSEINRLGLTKDVKLLGYVNDLELKWLYENCFCSIYPSLFEGFGLPVLEAMTLGAVVITSNTSSIPEIVGDAGIMINPQEEQDIFRAMSDLLMNQNQRENLKVKAQQRAKQFSWSSSAKAVLNLYQKIIF